MAEYDLFQLINFPFDPPEKNGKKVKDKIEETKKELNATLGTATQQLERDEINKKISFLNTKSASIFMSDGKLDPQYYDLAKARTDEEIESLKAAVSLLKNSGMHVVTNGTIRSQRSKTKLSKENIEKVYRDAKFSILEIDPLKAMPKFPTNAEKTFDEIEALRQIKNPDPNGADLTLVKDLYSFVAYLSGEPENAAAYKTKSTSELANLLGGFAKQFSARNDDLGKLCASLVASARSYVFDSDNNRQAYNAYLLYKSPSLTQLFNTMKRNTEANLLDSKIAENCIKQISEIFGDYDIALAIYNKEAGLQNNPYIPEKAIFLVRCSHCQNIVEFSDAQEAQEKNKCTFCEKPLYKACNKCHKGVLVSSDRCLECGYVFVSPAMFAKHFASAEKALQESNFKEARNYLYDAESADPSEKDKIIELKARISALEEKYEKPVNDLHKLIAEKKFQKASEELAAIIVTFPKLNVAAFETQINTVISQVTLAFSNSKKLTQSKQADTCLEILSICSDFRPAIDFLLATPPLSCKSLSIGVDTTACYATISWSRSAEQGITYRIVRKTGKTLPLNELDGEILQDNIQETTYRDTTLVPGLWYSYAVFAIRHRVFSSAVGNTIVLLAEVKDVHCEQLDTTIRITWNAPQNCTGITIYRKHNSKESVLANNAHGSFEDKDVKFGVLYSYKLCANYVDLSPSQGIVAAITPTVKVEPFSIQAKQIKDNIYKISWDIKRSEIDLRILVNEKDTRKLKADSTNCEIELPPDGSHTISVLAFSGGDWLRSKNDITLFTYLSCQIDKDLTMFREPSMAHGQAGLLIKLINPLPKNVSGFFYTIRTKNSPNESAPWADINEIKSAQDIHRISLTEYQKGNELIDTKLVQDKSSYYVSLFTIYNINGKEIISTPQKCRLNRPLEANVFWKIDKTFLGGLKLSIEITANRPFERIPKWILKSSDEFLISHSAGGTELLVIPEVVSMQPQKVYKNNYDIPAMSLGQIKNKNFFLFEAERIETEDFAVRWNKGFSGKV